MSSWPSASWTSRATWRRSASWSSRAWSASRRSRSSLSASARAARSCSVTSTAIPTTRSTAPSSDKTGRYVVWNTTSDPSVAATREVPTKGLAGERAADGAGHARDAGVHVEHRPADHRRGPPGDAVEPGPGREHDDAVGVELEERERGRPQDDVEEVPRAGGIEESAGGGQGVHALKLGGPGGPCPVPIHCGLSVLPSHLSDTRSALLRHSAPSCPLSFDAPPHHWRIVPTSMADGAAVRVGSIPERGLRTRGRAASPPSVRKANQARRPPGQQGGDPRHRLGRSPKDTRLRLARRCPVTPRGLDGHPCTVIRTGGRSSSLSPAGSQGGQATAASGRGIALVGSVIECVPPSSRRSPPGGWRRRWSRSRSRPRRSWPGPAT